MLLQKTKKKIEEDKLTDNHLKVVNTVKKNFLVRRIAKQKERNKKSLSTGISSDQNIGKKIKEKPTNV